MLNYISAEWYKLRHTKGIFVAFGLLLLLIIVLFLPAFWYRDPTTMEPNRKITMELYAAAYLATLLLGFFLAPPFAIRAFDDQYGRGTMKNEVVFGIPRSRIYLGKLAFGALAGTVAAAVVLAFYLLLCLLMGGLGAEYDLLCLDLCVRGTLMAYPLWLASHSLAFFLQVVLRSSAGAVAIDYLILFFCSPISMIGFGEAANRSPVYYFFDRLFFVAPFRGIYGGMDVEQGILTGMGYSWLVGLGWIAVTSLVGMAIFTRKEIS